jgi:hypothetical protein
VLIQSLLQADPDIRPDIDHVVRLASQCLALANGTHQVTSVDIGDFVRYFCTHTHTPEVTDPPPPFFFFDQRDSDHDIAAIEHAPSELDEFTSEPTSTNVQKILAGGGSDYISYLICMGSQPFLHVQRSIDCHHL